MTTADLDQIAAHQIAMLLQNVVGDASSSESRDLARDILAQARDEWENRYWDSLRKSLNPSDRDSA